MSDVYSEKTYNACTLLKCK